MKVRLFDIIIRGTDRQNVYQNENTGQQFWLCANLLHLIGSRKKIYTSFYGKYGDGGETKFWNYLSVYHHELLSVLGQFG